MFVHLAKDYMKKLDEVDRRLETSLEKEEIQTLGLKLRFYYNEIKHYNQLLGNVFSRIREIQEKYGFAGDEKANGDFPDPAEVFRETEPPADSPRFEALSDQKALPAHAGQKSREELVGLVTDWIRDLDSQGVDVEDVLLRPRKMEEILSSDSRTNLTDAMGAPTGVTPTPTAAPVADGDTATVEIPLDDKPRFEANGIAAESANTKEITESRQESAAVERELPGEGAGGAAEADSLPLKLAEWETALEKGGVELVLDGVREHVKKHRVECLGFIAADSVPSVARADSKPKMDFLHGLLAMLLGNNGSAINMLESALRKTGAPPETNRILADCYFQKGLYENALANYREAISIGAQREESLIEASGCLLRLGRFAEAAEILDGAEFTDRSTRLHAGIRRAEAQLGLKQHREALDMAKALLDECETPTERSLCYHLMARVKEAKADLVSAIDLYERSLENDTMNAPARLALGKLCMNNNAIPLAKNHFHFIARNFPESEWADEARLLLYNMARQASSRKVSEAAQA